MKLKIKKGDKVTVMSGSQKGKTGKVMSVNPTKLQVVIEGVNMRKHHEKAKPNQPGGIISKEGPVHYSNVLVNDEKSGKPSRVGYRTTDKGKERYAKRSGTAL